MVENDTRFPIDSSPLADFARRAVGSPTAGIVDWTAERISGGIGSTTGAIFRVSGTLREGPETRPWSMIVKAARPPSEGIDVASPDYWKREALLFQSDLLDDLPEGLAAPRCFGAVERSDGTWLALEEVAEEVGQPWPLARHGLAARHLGRFNGLYLAGRPLPTDPWLTRGLARAKIAETATYVGVLRTMADDPLVRRGWPGDARDRTLRLWDTRERYLSMLERLPRVLIHGDATDQNLFARRSPTGRDQTVAIDWAFCGLGAVGEDLAPQFRSRVRESVGPAELDGTIFEGYLDGLRDAGWTGDGRMARLGFSAAVALRYGLNPLVLRAVADVDYRRRLEETFHASSEEIFAARSGLREYLLDRAAEATALGDALGL